MGTFADVVDITISVQAVTPSSTGFGEMLILAADCPGGFTQRARHYFAPGNVGLAQMVTDGFTTTDATYLAAEAAFAQNPSPVSVCVGRLANIPTQVYSLTPAAAALANTEYTTVVNGTTYNATPTVAGANAAVQAQLNALGSISGLTIAGVAGPPQVVCASGENTINVSTFVGSQTLTATASTAAFASSGTVSVVTSAGTAVIAYTGITGDTFTNCTLITGSGTLSTSNAINQWASLTLTATTAGAFNTLAIGDSTLNTLAQTTANAGLAADLAAISAYDSTWYAINADAWGSSPILIAASAFAEANTKIHVSATVDSNCANLAQSPSSTEDVMSTAQTDSYSRTALMYAQDTSQFTGAAWLGARLPLAPGSENWKFASLNGVATVKLTGTQVNNIKAKSGNYYYLIGAVPITASGNTANGSFLDLVRGRDWFAARLGTRIIGVLTSTGQKVPFTDQGIAQIEGEVRAQCDEAILSGFLAANPAPIVTAPLAADVDNTDRGNRNLPGVTFQAVSAGAINTVAVTGIVLL